MKKYDIKFGNIKGFYEWNSDKFAVRRKKEFEAFKKKNGFSPDECWDIGLSTALFILPRLKYYKEHVSKGTFYPVAVGSKKKWLNIIDQVIYSFEFIIESKERYSYEEAKKYEKGIKLFGRWFFCLF